MTNDDSIARRQEARAAITAHLFGREGRGARELKVSSRSKLTLDRETVIVALLVAIIAGTMARAGIRVVTSPSVKRERVVAAVPKPAPIEPAPSAMPEEPIANVEKEALATIPRPPHPKPRPKPRVAKAEVKTEPKADVRKNPDVDRSLEKAKRTLAHAESELASTL